MLVLWIMARRINNKLYSVHFLLKHFGDREGYVDNTIDGCTALVSAIICEANVKIVRLLLDYGADADVAISIARNRVGVSPTPIEKMLLQIPAIRGNSFGWPVKSELESAVKSEMKSEMIGEEFSDMVVAMRGRASRKPLVFVRVNEPGV